MSEIGLPGLRTPRPSRCPYSSRSAVKSYLIGRLASPITHNDVNYYTSRGTLRFTRIALNRRSICGR